jgi:hypothetical protein
MMVYRSKKRHAIKEKQNKDANNQVDFIGGGTSRKVHGGVPAIEYRHVLEGDNALKAHEPLPENRQLVVTDSLHRTRTLLTSCAVPATRT